MKLLVDFFPILLFFIAYKVYDIYVATIVAIVAAFAQVAYSWLKNRHVETMHWVTLGIIVLFGGATLILQDELFIKWKPSVINWIFALIFLGSQFIGKKSIIERLMGKSMTLPSSIWTKLNAGWVVFFFIAGFANLYVVYNYDTDTWVNFKLFGMMGLTLLFIVAQGFYLTKYIKNQ